MDKLVKIAVAPFMLEINPAVGAAFTVIRLGWVNELVLPPAEVTTSVTSYTPGTKYCTVGFSSVEVLGVPPGNSQAQLTGSPEEISVKVVVNTAQPLLVLTEKPASGSVVITTFCVKVLVPQSLEAVSTTVYVPSEAYVCVGFGALLCSSSPKSQL